MDFYHQDNGFNLQHGFNLQPGFNLHHGFNLTQQMHTQLASILQMAAQRQETQQIVQQQRQQIMSLQMQCNQLDREPITYYTCSVYANTQHTYTMHFNL
jgi:hypothetical protein